MELKVSSPNVVASSLLMRISFSVALKFVLEISDASQKPDKIRLFKKASVSKRCATKNLTLGLLLCS